MSLIERWGVAPLPATRLDSPRLHSIRLDSVWEPVITQSETLPERGARESSTGRTGGIRGPCRSHERNVYEGVTKGRKKTRRRRRKGHELERGVKRDPNRTGASHKHPHNDLCDERPFGLFLHLPGAPHLFLSLRPRCARAYFLGTRPPPSDPSSPSLRLLPNALCDTRLLSLSLSFSRGPFFPPCRSHISFLRLICSFWAPLLSHSLDSFALSFLTGTHPRYLADRGFPRCIFATEVRENTSGPAGELVLIFG